MRERVDIVSMRGNSLTLVGNEVKVGDEAPDFVVLANDLSPVRFHSSNGIGQLSMALEDLPERSVAIGITIEDAEDVDEPGEMLLITELQR